MNDRNSENLENPKVAQLWLETTVTIPSHSPQVEETYIHTKLTLSVATNFPYTSSDQDIYWMVVGFVKMTDRLQMVNHLCPATHTLPSQTCQSHS